MITHGVTNAVRSRLKRQFISFSLARHQSTIAKAKQVQVDYKPIRSVLVANRGKME